MEKTITLPYDEYVKFETLQKEVNLLKEMLEKEKKRKNGYVFLNTSLNSYGLGDESNGKTGVRIGTLSYQVKSSPVWIADDENFKRAIQDCIRHILLHPYNHVILTKDAINKELDKIAEQRKFLNEEMKIANDKHKALQDKLDKLPKWVKWFL